MDKIRVAVASATEGVADLRPVLMLRSLFSRATGASESQRGQGLAEYALILAGIAVVAIASLVFLGGTISELFWAPINVEFAQILSRLGI